ncbi:MAG: hypothetical protein HGB36_09595 [Chlorobiaceae bacterium]|nr:hypothetical protein [Chlorobiaceae bacterium]
MFFKDNILKSEWNNYLTLLGYWILLLFMVFAGSFMPFSSILHYVFLIDTIAHLILFSILAFIPMILMQNRKAALLISLAMTPVGYLLEWLHIVVTDESFSAINVFANNAGVFAGMITGFIVRLKNHYSQEENR